MPRTIESLQQIIHGLYPTSKCDGNVTPTLLVRYDQPCYLFSSLDNTDLHPLCDKRIGMAKTKISSGTLTGVSD